MKVKGIVANDEVDANGSRFLPSALKDIAESGTVDVRFGPGGPVVGTVKSLRLTEKGVEAAISVDAKLAKAAGMGGLYACVSGNVKGLSVGAKRCPNGEPVEISGVQGVSIEFTAYTSGTQAPLVVVEDEP